MEGRRFVIIPSAAPSLPARRAPNRYHCFPLQAGFTPACFPLIRSSPLFVRRNGPFIYRVAAWGDASFRNLEASPSSPFFGTCDAALRKLPAPSPTADSVLFGELLRQWDV